MMAKTKVVVAMSGGVDSSVAAVLLRDQGYDVTGMMLRLWSETGREDSNRCCTPDAMAQARRVAARLGIPFYAVDAQVPFHNRVVSSFFEGYAAGVTPNPCIMCNRHIRWGFLLEQAKAIGAEYLVTGHYARLVATENGKVQLLRAVDLQKDQSYVLSSLNQDQLRQTILPLGELTKGEVREIARHHGLAVADRADSQDLCFLAGEDYRQFLRRNAPGLTTVGPIYNLQGKLVGEHQGLAFYTIGQRKGLGISSPEPHYVIEKRIRENTLIVGVNDEMGSTSLIAGPMNWVSGSPPEKDLEVDVKIRYRASPARAQFEIIEEGKIRITFVDSIRDITPGQLVVLYQGENVLGSGIILT